MSPLDHLRSEFNGHIAFKEKRPGILQVFAPLFHEDGDMIDITAVRLNFGGAE
jgi:hypothetical protein